MKRIQLKVETLFLILILLGLFSVLLSLMPAIKAST